MVQRKNRKNIFDEFWKFFTPARFSIFGGPWSPNFAISHIAYTLIYICYMFTTHISHFQLRLNPTVCRVHAQNAKISFFSKNFDNFSKSMGVEKWIFSLGIFLVYFCLERVQMKEFLNYLTGKWVKSRILENFGKFFGNIFHGHFGQLNIE